MPPKIPHTHALTARQSEWLTRESKAKGISPGEFLRRVIDEAMERKPGGLAGKVYQPQ